MSRSVNTIFINLKTKGITNSNVPTTNQQILNALRKIEVYKVTNAGSIKNIKQLINNLSKRTNTKNVSNKFKNKINSLKTIRSPIPPGQIKNKKVTRLGGGFKIRVF
jgi:hypothetical protein